MVEMTELDTTTETNGGWLGAYRREVGRLAAPDADEATDLVGRLRRGDRQAADEIALRHLGLVVDEVGRCGAEGCEALDLLERGNRALVEAIDALCGRDGHDCRTFLRSAIRRAVRGDRLQ